MQKAYRGVLLGDWLFADGDVFRVVMRRADGGLVLSNWSRPKLNWLRAVLRKVLGA